MKRFPAAMILALATLVIAPGCQLDHEAPVHFDPPAPDSAQLPNWCRFHNGAPCLTWVEPDGDGHALKLAWLEDGNWSEPRKVASGEDWFVNWADFPSAIELASGDLVAHWLERSGPGTFHYDIRVARSEDRGRTWSEPVTPHLDGTRSEHGFVSLFPASDNRAGLVWLDGRHTVENDENEEGHEGGHGGGHGSDDAAGPMTLRAAELTPDLTPDDKAELDGRVCDCCQTSTAQASENLVTVYRGRTEEEIRDIQVLRKDVAGWSRPRLLRDDGWEIPGCPVNGPAVAADGQFVAVAWYTAADPGSRVQLKISRDGGESFEEPVEIDGAHALGHVDVAVTGPKQATVSWLRNGQDGAELAHRVYDEQGPGPVQIVGGVGAGRSAGFPRLVSAESGTYLTWTDARGETSSLHVARISR